MKKGKLGGVIAATHSLFHATRYCGATVELLRLILVLLLLVLCVALAPLTLQCSRVPLPANVSVGHWAPYSTDVRHRCFFSLLSIILGQFFFSFSPSFLTFFSFVRKRGFPVWFFLLVKF